MAKPRKRASSPDPSDPASSPTKRPRTSKKPASSPSQWRASRIRQGTTITKTNAMLQYRLKSTDLAGLSYQEETTVVQGTERTMFLYDERSIERKAWEKHGGPEGFEAYLDNLRRRHAKSKKGTIFTEPASYATPGVYIMKLRPADPQSKYVGSSVKLLHIKKEMPEWLWEKFNIKLDKYYDDTELIYFGVPIRERELPMKRALAMAKKYPQRSTELLPASASVTALRQVLDSVPSAPERIKWRSHVEGLEYCETESLESADWYQWDKDLTRRIFEALIGVINEHGTEGWEAVRWKVYDKSDESLKNGLHFTSEYGDAYWSDQAAEWLNGRLCDQALWSTCRERSSIGKKYNSMLPILNGGWRTV